MSKLMFYILGLVSGISLSVCVVLVCDAFLAPDRRPPDFLGPLPYPVEDVNQEMWQMLRGIEEEINDAD